MRHMLPLRKLVAVSLLCIFFTIAWAAGHSEELSISFTPLSYNTNLEQREIQSVDLIVIHSTELPDIKTARKYAEKIHYQGSQTGNSGHFYIDRKGRVEQYVSVNRVAHHVVGFNKRSIGIELDNPGRYPNWLDSNYQYFEVAYTDVQIDSLIKLIQQLTGIYPSLSYIAGHEELDQRTIASSDNDEILVNRKMDPSELFPWDRVLQGIELKPQQVK